jgi:hypothetical protein
MADAPMPSLNPTLTALNPIPKSLHETPFSSLSHSIWLAMAILSVASHPSWPSGPWSGSCGDRSKDLAPVLQQQQMPILGVQHQPGVGQHRRQVVGVGGSDQVVRPGSLPRSGICMFTGHISG